MTRQGKVFITQEPTRRNRNTGEIEASIDLTPAAVYGELVVLLPPGNMPTLSSAPVTNKLIHALRNFCDDDYVLAVGNPDALMLVGAIAAKFNRGRYKSLVWDKRIRQYIASQKNINGGGM